MATMLSTKMNATLSTAKPTGAQCARVARGLVNSRPARRMHVAASVVTLERPTITKTSLSVDGKVVHEMAMAGVQRLLEQAREVSTVEVTFKVHLKCGLGERVKLVGGAPELGRWTPEVARYAKWTEGDVWETKLPVRVGTYTYKVVVRKAYGEFMYEKGEDRILELVEADVAGGVEVEIRDVEVPKKEF